MYDLYIKWDEKYNLGIPIIDEQHRAIVSTINTYHYFFARGNEGAALKLTLITLEQYTMTHFMTEENIFKQTEYPESASHKKLHNYLIKRMRDIAIETIQENDPDILLHFLKEWWLSHIRIEDSKYSPHVKGKLMTT